MNAFGSPRRSTAGTRASSAVSASSSVAKRSFLTSGPRRATTLKRPRLTPQRLCGCDLRLDLAQPARPAALQAPGDRAEQAVRGLVVAEQGRGEALDPALA